MPRKSRLPKFSGKEPAPKPEVKARDVELKISERTGRLSSIINVAKRRRHSPSSHDEDMTLPAHQDDPDVATGSNEIGATSAKKRRTHKVPCPTMTIGVSVLYIRFHYPDVVMLQQRMHNWLRDMRHKFLDVLLAHEALPTEIVVPCDVCRSSTRLGEYRCQDCLGSCLMCRDCIVSAHSKLPLHNVEVGYSACKRYFLTNGAVLGPQLLLAHFASRVGTYSRLRPSTW